MDFYTRKSRWKLWLTFAALGIVGASIVYTNHVAGNLEAQEHNRMQMWAEFLRLQTAIPPMQDFDFTPISEMVEGNTTIPVILTDEGGRILAARNFEREYPSDTAWFSRQLAELKAVRPPIVISDAFGGKQYIYYRTSQILEMLSWFPIIQLTLIAVLLLLAYLAFSTARRSEQNLVWVGMAKETAHQLGTPISSLVGWVEILREMEPDNENVKMVTEEFLRDVKHLQLVADRFSKIGAKPLLEPANLYDVLERNLGYVKPRASKHITFDFPPPDSPPVWVNINPLLFDWVVENLLKNALDAMEAVGEIKAHISEDSTWAYLDITDSGKGIPRSKFKTIFRPGFTTKKRGWGLGLTLTKRIVEEYHDGKIFVKNSVLGEGTTFRIQLPYHRALD